VAYWLVLVVLLAWAPADAGVLADAFSLADYAWVAAHCARFAGVDVTVAPDKSIMVYGERASQAAMFTECMHGAQQALRGLTAQLR
jgi:hypothetical protein